jgi:putative intracellular protease/amidase
VRERLEKSGVKVVTASTDGGTSKPYANPNNRGDPVGIDVRLTADMPLSGYSAVVFCGYRSDEYMFASKGSFAAGRVIERMRQDGKPVAAICVGQGVLITHGALRGRYAALCKPLQEKHPFITDSRSFIKWEDKPVVVDGKIVTAAGPEHAREFADALVKLMDGK